jgi:hypothetical protein
LNDDNQREYSMLESDIVQEDMFHLLMEFWNHRMLMECVSVVSIVEEIDRNDTSLLREVNFVQSLSIEEKVLNSVHGLQRQRGTTTEVPLFHTLQAV